MSEPDPRTLPIPEHYEPTSKNPSWRGKIRCAYCTATGWPMTGNYPGWMAKHGANCKHRKDRS